MKRMKVPVLARLNKLAPDEYTWYYIDCLVLPTSIKDAVDVVEAGITVRDEVQLYTKEPQPTLRVYLNNDTTSTIFADYIYWDDKWYFYSGQAKYAKLGRSSYRHVVMSHKLDDAVAAKFPLPPPDFQEGYLDFLDSVGTVTNAVELPLTQLCIKIQECN